MKGKGDRGGSEEGEGGRRVGGGKRRAGVAIFVVFAF